jgi:two-component system sensor histidine kinase YesM
MPNIRRLYLMKIKNKYFRVMFDTLTSLFKTKSIQFIVTVSFAFTTIIAIIFIGVTLVSKYTRAAEQNVETNAKQIIEQVSMNLDYYQINMIEIVNLIESEVNKNAELPNYKLAEQMDVIIDVRDDIVSLSIFSNKGDIIVGMPFNQLKKDVNVKDQQWYKEATNGTQGIFFSAPHVQNLFPAKHNWVVSIARPIRFNYKEELVEGIILVDMNFSGIDQLCKKVSLGKRGYIYITDAQGNLIYHPQQQLIYAGLKTEDNREIPEKSYGSFLQNFYGEERLVTVKTVGYTGWKLVAVSYMDEVVQSKREIINFSGYILVFAIIFVISIIVIISAKVTKPIKRLDRYMKKVEAGNFDIQVNITGDAEVVHLSKTFNLMVARIRQLMEQIILEQEAKRKSELNALQAQINPHFLYNTLDSIVWMAENEKSSDVITMVTSLARLFRISISRGHNIITVGEELEHARNYLVIQKIRYKNKFEYSIEVDETVLKYKTIKLILQPIIENAIYHGIEYMVDEGKILISAKVVDDKLLYEITDNGLGMKAENIKNILSYESKNKGGSGVGVKNVHERIQLSFGKEYGVDIESELEVGTKVSVWLPILSEEP